MNKGALTDAASQILLAEAAWKFASRRLRAEARRAASLPAPTAKPFSNSEEARSALIDLATKFPKYLLSCRKPEREMRNRLVKKLTAGQLTALGVQTSPIVSGKPAIIEPWIFDGRPAIDWKNNIVRNFGVTFERVRITAVGGKSYSIISKGLDSGQHSRPGRPSKEEQIAQLIDELVIENSRIGLLPRKSAIDLIRSEAHARGLDTSIGYSDPVLQRAILRKFGKRINSTDKPDI